MPDSAAGSPPDQRGAPVRLRRGDPSDAPVVAALHHELIAEGFLSSLGPRFLRRLYRRVALSGDSFLLVAEVDAVPVGFIAGSVSLGRLYRRFIVRDGVAAALGSARQLLGAWRRALETLRHGGEGGAGAPAAELLAVAVAPAWRGRGVGARLVTGFLAEVAAMAGDASRVVVGAENATAIAMYRRAGFTAARTFELHPGTTSLLMEHGGAGTGARPAAP
ncbi:MAG TPA: GNAT family N-acetyltransferase [Acidimicrobiales bacterium]|nr:GNAT family N-acetyltransferase [Acidimicrobiales bacterium]